ncbi:MAG: glycogen/starch synthase [Gammaproteobacteria bacterium]|nr:glycogen/starch synthase [Gammaproteobacteria bacterium]
MINNMFLVIDASSNLNLDPLSKHRSPGAIPFCGKYRLIDFNLSSATYSDILNVGIFTGFNYRSLLDHIGSGDRYDLDRRVDGIFILQPKTTNPVVEEFISFGRLNEQKEFFKRTAQEYVIITPQTLVWNCDFNKLLEYHISKKADITQVVNSKRKRLYTFILKKEKLMEYINQYSDISYRNIVEVFDFSNGLKKATYKYERFAEYIRSIDDYYKVSMTLIKNNDIIINNKDMVRTKDPINPPTYYGKKAKSINSIVASGALIYGEIENSIISRRALIEEGAVVKNSIIMNTVTIKKNAIVENAIIDKECVVEEGLVVRGTKSEVFVTEKSTIVKSIDNPNVAILSVECSPFIKTGGLADMIGSLAIELAGQGVKTKVFLPLHKEIKEKYHPVLEKDKEIKLEINGTEYHINTYKIVIKNCIFVFIDLYMFFDRDRVYGYEDDAYRFAYFSSSVLEYLKVKGDIVDIIHLNDWHTALTTLFIKKYPEFKDTKTILTIHNLNYQGETSKEIVDHFHFDYYVAGNRFNILEAGINSADIISTVSKTYAEELKYTYYSGNLNAAILRKTSKLYGIVNGLDDKFDPRLDLEIKEQYDIESVFDKKPTNKKFLMDLCGFSYDDDTYVIGLVSRLDYIKGFDLILDSLDEILKEGNTKFILLGTGDERIKERLKEIEDRHPESVKCFLDYYGTKAEYRYAGSDADSMPSRIEPCGTSQMIALRYGTIPIVRQTGGLNDTIRNYEADTKEGNGFKFYNYDSRDLIYTVNLSRDVFRKDKEGWNRLILNAMSCDNGFERCAREYINLYNLIKKRS